MRILGTNAVVDDCAEQRSGRPERDGTAVASIDALGGYVLRRQGTRHG